LHLNDPAYKARLQEWGLGYPEVAHEAERWRQISIGMNAEKIATPLLLQVADSELLPETQTFSALSEFGKPVEERCTFARHANEALTQGWALMH
jgi:hypothetical protein